MAAKSSPCRQYRYSLAATGVTPVAKMVADVARTRKRVRILLSHVEVPHLTGGPNGGGRCEPAHIGGCKFLRSTAQMCKEAVKSALGLGCVKTRRRSIAIEEVIRPRPF